MNRRDFLKLTGAGGAALIVPNWPKTSGKPIKCRFGAYQRVRAEDFKNRDDAFRCINDLGCAMRFGLYDKKQDIREYFRWVASWLERCRDKRNSAYVVITTDPDDPQKAYDWRLALRLESGGTIANLGERGCDTALGLLGHEPWASELRKAWPRATGG